MLNNFDYYSIKTIINHFVNLTSKSIINTHTLYKYIQNEVKITSPILNLITSPKVLNLTNFL